MTKHECCVFFASLVLAGCGGSDTSNAGTPAGTGGASGPDGGMSASGGSSGGATGNGGASGVTGTGGVPTGPTTAAACFADISDGPIVIDYDQFKPKLDSCSGTNHQTITGVEKIVYLGDSITNGDYISPKYIATLTPLLQGLFPNAAVADCSKGGARNDDFLAGGNQIPQCFPTGVEQMKT